MPLPLNIIIPAIFIVIAAGIIVWRNSKPRRLRVEAMWIRPAIFIALAALTMMQAPPTQPLIIGVCVLAFIAGAGLGFMRGRMMRLSVDPETHVATVQGSPIAILFILALIALRFGLNLYLNGPNAYAGGAHGHVSQLTDALLIFAVGIFIAQNADLYLRAQRMIGESKAAAASRPVTAN